MARILTIGGADRAVDLARELRSDGHAVRTTTTDPARRGAIEAAGAECVIADPDVVGTLRYAVDNVTIMMWLLGDDERPELHGSRWQMMLERTIDTVVRGIVYEAGPPEGVALTQRMATYNEIPFRVIERDADAWTPLALQAVNELLQESR